MEAIGLGLALMAVWWAYSRGRCSGSRAGFAAGRRERRRRRK